MSQDPIRAMRDRQQERKRALADGHYARAVMDGKAPSVIAFCTALDSGLTGDDALTAAHDIDQAAANFTPPAA